MSKDLHMNAYLDFYDSLLTGKQKDVMDMYYKEDYSLSEIAENMNISRSAVSDLLKRVGKTLHEYETKLQLVEKFEKRNALYEQLEKIEDTQVQHLVKQLKELE